MFVSVFSHPINREQESFIITQSRKNTKKEATNRMNHRISLECALNHRTYFFLVRSRLGSCSVAVHSHTFKHGKLKLCFNSIQRSIPLQYLIRFPVLALSLSFHFSKKIFEFLTQRNSKPFAKIQRIDSFFKTLIEREREMKKKKESTNNNRLFTFGIFYVCVCVCVCV